jgi:hypothetical protein
VGPDTLAGFRRRIDAALMAALIALHAAAAMEQGQVSPAPLVVATFPAEPAPQRVTDAPTWDTAHPQVSHSRQGSTGHASRAPPR